MQLSFFVGLSVTLWSTSSLYVKNIFFSVDIKNEYLKYLLSNLFYNLPCSSMFFFNWGCLPSLCHSFTKLSFIFNLLFSYLAYYINHMYNIHTYIHFFCLLSICFLFTCFVYFSLCLFQFHLYISTTSLFWGKEKDAHFSFLHWDDQQYVLKESTLLCCYQFYNCFLLNGMCVFLNLKNRCIICNISIPTSKLTYCINIVFVQSTIFVHFDLHNRIMVHWYIKKQTWI